MQKRHLLRTFNLPEELISHGFLPGQLQNAERSHEILCLFCSDKIVCMIKKKKEGEMIVSNRYHIRNA